MIATRYVSEDVIAHAMQDVAMLVKERVALDVGPLVSMAALEDAKGVQDVLDHAQDVQDVVLIAQDVVALAVLVVTGIVALLEQDAICLVALHVLLRVKLDAIQNAILVVEVVVREHAVAVAKVGVVLVADLSASMVVLEEQWHQVNGGKL